MNGYRAGRSSAKKIKEEKLKTQDITIAAGREAKNMKEEQLKTEDITIIFSWTRAFRAYTALFVFLRRGETSPGRWLGFTVSVASINP